MKKDLIATKEITANDIKEIFSLTDKLKINKQAFNNALSGKTLALIFQKPSNRTRVSFEAGMYQLGGYSIYLGSDEINLGVRESIKDVAKTLSRYVDAIALRTFAHKNVVELAKFASVPVINALSDAEHPCQALADVYTIREKLKNKKDITVVYIGDANNVCVSLLYACAKLGIKTKIASPKGYQPQASVAKETKTIVFDNPQEAVKDADVLYTDVWTSMGQEKEAAQRKKIFKDFQINEKLLKLANKNALVMHCLPAHRGEEITDAVMESKNSVIFDQAENRMHVQKAILILLLKKRNL